MKLTGNQKLLILGLVVVVILYLVYMQKEGAGNVAPDAQPEQVAPEQVAPEQVAPEQEIAVQPSYVKLVDDSTLLKNDSDRLLLQKMTTKNSAKDGEYKQVSFADDKRDSSSKNLDDFFEQGNPLNSNETDIYDDGYHPNPKGNNLVYNALKAEISLV